VADLRDIPEIQSAVSAEREARQEAWLQIEEPLCGVPVRPLTLRMVLYLDLAQNWYAAGAPEPISVADPDYLRAWTYQQAEFLWVVSEAFVPGGGRPRDRFFKSLRRKDAPAMDAAITAYYAAAYFDAPSAGPASSMPPRIDWIASIVHEFAAAYHWPVDQILDTPLRILLQLRRCLQASADPKAYADLPNPRSDAAQAAWLSSLASEKNKKGRL